MILSNEFIGKKNIQNWKVIEKPLRISIQLTLTFLHYPYSFLIFATANADSKFTWCFLIISPKHLPYIVLNENNLYIHRFLLFNLTKCQEEYLILAFLDNFQSFESLLKSAKSSISKSPT